MKNGLKIWKFIMKLILLASSGGCHQYNAMLCIQPSVGWQELVGDDDGDGDGDGDGDEDEDDDDGDDDDDGCHQYNAAMLCIQPSVGWQELVAVPQTDNLQIGSHSQIGLEFAPDLFSIARPWQLRAIVQKSHKISKKS